MIYVISRNTENILFESTAYRLADKADLLDWLKDKDQVSLDTETSGLDFLSDQLILVILGDESNQFVIDARDTDLTFIKPALQDRDVEKIIHNLTFDYKFLKNRGIILENVYDTMLSETVLTAGKTQERSSLQSLVFKYCNEYLFKEERMGFTTLGQAALTESLITYAAKDVQFLPKICKAQKQLLSSHRLELRNKLECYSYLALADVEYVGMNLDKKAWLELAGYSASKAKEHAENLDRIIETDERFGKFIARYIQGDLFIPKEELRKVTVEWNSPKQVLEVMKTIDNTLTSVAATELDTIRYSHDIIEEYLTYKEYEKARTSYGEEFFEYLGRDGRIHTSFRTVSTGRLASSNPNLQQIPADNKYRNCFIPIHPDYVFVSADYSSQELALIAHDSQDPVWLKALTEGKDLHSVCAELLFGEQWLKASEPDCAYYHKSDGIHIDQLKCECSKHKKMRTAAKSINFGLSYGAGADKVSRLLHISTEEADNLIREFFAQFPLIKQSLERSARFGVDKGYIRTMSPYGWKRWFSREMSKGSIERQSKNTRIQGSAADMIKEALILTRRHIIDNNLPVVIVNTVHDQIDTNCRKDYVPTWQVEFKAIMEEAARTIIPSGLLKAEVTVSDVWTK